VETRSAGRPFNYATGATGLGTREWSNAAPRTFKAATPTHTGTSGGRGGSGAGVAESLPRQYQNVDERLR